MGIKRVGVVGGGQMGGGVAELTAKAGLPTVVREVTPEVVERSQAGIHKSLDRALERGKLDEAAHGAALGNLSFTTEIGDLSDCDLVVEAVVESFDLKARSSGLSTRSWPRPTLSWPPTPRPSRSSISPWPRAARSGSSACTSSTRPP